ncbi:acyl-CoA dehydrogenase [Salegentibacter sp. LM13S]|uniref:acyl-CoA dehydrogenase n=1 Tax=Salegentibacter lacus TaxID=2873599 RepID=UPI001CCC8FCA|nr:acyl-CoA dehydrogenase [Salegentibacter lacus]MBZ9629506.1 acyl-CoA dehydrogenase [Salegentibacter lacus]
MKEDNKQQALRKLCLGADIFPEEVLTWIAEENLWNIWVPRNYGGLELSLTEGLEKLKKLTKIDGSLGWTVTLCSGANYFIGNLEPETAKEVFKKPHATVLGGSGGVFGTAEKLGYNYKISGTWRYATGAPYLTHFTLNAEIHENGKALLNEDGSPKIRSFVLPKEEVRLIEDWDTMGLKASVTHSFEVKDALISKRFSFIYNKFYQPQDIFKIPFSVFADLTLWVNYIGMAEHFLAEAQAVKPVEALKNLEENLNFHNQQIRRYSESIEAKIAAQEKISKNFIEEIHISASNSVKNISRNIIENYPYLGVKASQKNHPLNQVFCDYFTATQHHIFTK